MSSAANRRLATIVKAGAAWLLGSLLAWGCVLSFEMLRHLQDAQSVRGEVAYLGQLAVLQALSFSALPLLLHVLRAGLDRRELGVRAQTADAARATRGVRGTTWLVAALAIWPAWLEAEFLTSGSAVSELAYAQELQIALCGALVLGYAALWRWHLSGTLLRGQARGGLRAVLWFGIGLLALAGLFYALSFKLKAYAFFAKFLLPPAWFIASTLGFRALFGLRWNAWAGAATTTALLLAPWLLGAVAPEELGRARNTYMRRGKVAALSDLMVYPSDTESVSLKPATAESFECPVHPETRRLEPLAIPEKRRRNVILISVDALRRDAVGFEHDGRPVMPQLRAFAESSLRYERAVTTYPATLIAIGGALTGLNASQILFSPGVPDNVFKRSRERIPKQVVSLPKSRWFKKKIVSKLFLQGAEVERHASAAEQTTWMIGKLRAARRKRAPVFAWVHYYEPHQDYEKHEGFDFGDGTRERYMSELAYVDVQLGKLVAFLQRGRFFDDSLVVLFADHGEAIGELDYEGHHVYLNSWITDIPLLVRAPGLASATSHELADVTDIAVSVLHFLDLPVPWESSGISLLAPDPARRHRMSVAEAFPVRGSRLFKLANRRVKDLEAYQERMERIHSGAKNYLPQVSAVTAEHRLIVNRVTGLDEFYDRRSDPQERHDLSFERTEEHRALRERLSAWSTEQAKLLYCKVVQEPVAGATP